MFATACHFILYQQLLLLYLYYIFAKFYLHNFIRNPMLLFGMKKNDGLLQQLQMTRVVTYREINITLYYISQETNLLTWAT